jgi:hypothetical protein
MNFVRVGSKPARTRLINRCIALVGKNSNFDICDYMMDYDFTQPPSHRCDALKDQKSPPSCKINLKKNPPKVRCTSREKILNHDFCDYMMDYDFTQPPFPPVRCT